MGDDGRPDSCESKGRGALWRIRAIPDGLNPDDPVDCEVARLLAQTAPPPLPRSNNTPDDCLALTPTGLKVLVEMRRRGIKAGTAPDDRRWRLRLAEVLTHPFREYLVGDEPDEVLVVLMGMLAALQTGQATAHALFDDGRLDPIELDVWRADYLKALPPLVAGIIRRPGAYARVVLREEECCKLVDIVSGPPASGSMPTAIAADRPGPKPGTNSKHSEMARLAIAAAQNSKCPPGRGRKKWIGEQVKERFPKYQLESILRILRDVVPDL